MSAAPGPGTLSRARLLAGVAVLAITLPLLIRVLGLPRLIHWLAPATLPSPPDPGTFHLARGYTDAAVSRLPAHGGCLPRALILLRYGRMCGQPVHIHLGVRRTRNRLDGHAWVCQRGQALFENENPRQRYTITCTLPDPAPTPAGDPRTACNPV